MSAKTRREASHLQGPADLDPAGMTVQLHGRPAPNPRGGLPANGPHLTRRPTACSVRCEVLRSRPLAVTGTLGRSRVAAPGTAGLT